MDKIDVEIIKLLLDNSRLSYNQIAERLDVSINTVKCRIDKMLKEGLIRYHTIIKLDKFGYALFYILLRDDKPERVFEKLSLIGKVVMTIRCLGDTFVIGLAVKGYNNPLELVKALIEPYNAYIIFFKEASNIKLSKNSLRIIRYLLTNPRVKSKDVAESLGISTKTLKRSLDYLLKNDAIRLSIAIDPSKLDRYINFGLIIKIHDKKVINAIYNILEDHFLLAPMVYENAIITILYGESMQIIDKCYREIKGLEDVEHVDLVIPLSVDINPNIL